MTPVELRTLPFNTRLKICRTGQTGTLIRRKADASSYRPLLVMFDDPQKTEKLINPRTHVIPL